MLIKEAEVLNAYRAISREISSYRALGRHAETSEIARFCALWRNCANYREIPRRRRASRAISRTFPPGYSIHGKYPEKRICSPTSPWPFSSLYLLQTYRLSSHSVCHVLQVCAATSKSRGSRNANTWRASYMYMYMYTYTKKTIIY